MIVCGLPASTLQLPPPPLYGKQMTNIGAAWCLQYYSGRVNLHVTRVLQGYSYLIRNGLSSMVPRYLEPILRL